MRKLLFIAFSFITFSIFLISCNTSVDGKFVKKVEKGTKLQDQSIFEKITFGDKFCRVEYSDPVSFVKLNGNYSYSIDKNYIYIDTRDGFGILALEVVDSKTLKGVGAILGTFKKE